MFVRNRRSIFEAPHAVRFNRVPEPGTGEGEGGGEGGGGAGDGKKPPRVIAEEDHERALADLNKHKTRAAKLEADLKALNDAKLKENNDWKTLAETREKELEDLRGENGNLKSSFVNEKKETAVRAACEKLGIRPEAMDDLNMLDLAAIQVESTNTGKVTVLGADKFAERLKAVKPHWFADKTAPKVNTNGTRIVDPADANASITWQQVYAAEVEGRKTGNLSAYHELHKKYQAQRAANRR